MATAQDVYNRALSKLDEISDSGTVNTDTGYEGKAPLIIDDVQRECAFLEGVNVLSSVTALTDTLYVSDDTAFRVMHWGVAAQFALQDKMNDEYEFCNAKYERAKLTVRPSKLKKRDPYRILDGMQ
jgi:hypothetical protein